MKTLTVVVAVTMMAATVKAQNVASTPERSYFADAAEYQCINATKAADKYLACLSSENEGVVESALAHVAMMKVMVPACDYKALKTKVDEIVRSRASAETRYKAFLTKTVLEEPGMFDGMARGRYSDADGFFGAVASRMRDTFASR